MKTIMKIHSEMFKIYKEYLSKLIKISIENNLIYVDGNSYKIIQGKDINIDSICYHMNFDTFQNSIRRFFLSKNDAKQYLIKLIDDRNKNNEEKIKQNEDLINDILDGNSIYGSIRKFRKEIEKNNKTKKRLLHYEK